MQRKRYTEKQRMRDVYISGERKAINWMERFVLLTICNCMDESAIWEKIARQQDHCMR